MCTCQYCWHQLETKSLKNIQTLRVQSCNFLPLLKTLMKHFFLLIGQCIAFCLHERNPVVLCRTSYYHQGKISTQWWKLTRSQTDEFGSTVELLWFFLKEGQSTYITLEAPLEAGDDFQRKDHYTDSYT